MVTVNGKEQAFVPYTVLALLQAHGFQAATVAVECNGEILSRENWDKQLVADGDVYEIIRFVVGGWAWEWA